MKAATVVMAGALLLVGCRGAVSGTGTDSAPVTGSEAGTVRLLFAGDLMVGRGVARPLANEGVALFEDVRFVVSGADLAAANLESALADDPEVEAEVGVVLVGAADAAPVLAQTGFDLLSVANNHAGDAGEDSVASTVDALERHGISSIGVVGAGAPPAPVIREVAGVRVAYLAFDLTKEGPAPVGVHPGVAVWDPVTAVTAVSAAAVGADVVTVSLHGGVEYLPGPDPALRAAAARVAEAGADVVWAHGAHVTYPVEVMDRGDGGRTVVAYGLGNFLFDQHRRGTTRGAVLEVIADRTGVVAHRVGVVEHPGVRVRFTGWGLPDGDAVLLDGDWWQLTRPVEPIPRSATSGDVVGRHGEDVAAVASGDATGDGRTEVVVAFRRPYTERPVNRRFPDVVWTDELGRTAHLGVYRPEDLGPVWVASGLAHPVDDIAVCDGALAVGYGALRRGDPVFSGAWTWRGYGFIVAPDLPGAATPGCADVDGDGTLDPVLIDRS